MRVAAGYGIFSEALPASKMKARPASRLIANCSAAQARVGDKTRARPLRMHDDGQPTYSVSSFFASAGDTLPSLGIPLTVRPPFQPKSASRVDCANSGIDMTRPPYTQHVY
jgi:hypothetical protein